MNLQGKTGREYSDKILPIQKPEADKFYTNDYQCYSMNRILIILIFSMVPLSVNAQTNRLDKRIDVGNEYYENGQREKALRIWKRIIFLSSSKSSTYGTTLRNIQWYYIEANDDKNLLKYYHKIMNSKVNDRNRNHIIGEPYKNYRYISTMNLASYFAQKKEFEKALVYVNIADHQLTYYTTSLTRFIYKKVDLAFWKSWLYKDMNKRDSAMYVLIKRAFEYEYDSMYPDWSTLSQTDDEEQLSEEILKYFSNNAEKQQFIHEVKMAVDSLNLPGKVSADIRFTLRNMQYDIITHRDIQSLEDARGYLMDSFFYKYLIGLEEEIQL